MKEESLNKNYLNSEIIDMHTKASIFRDKNTKAASLIIDAPCEWVLYAGNTPESIDMETPIARGKDLGVYPLYINPSQRSYFKIVTEMGSAFLSENLLPMEGGFNFRDLGGLKSCDGKYIKWGYFFRSDDLYNLTEDDLNYLSGIPITTVVDFRCEEECNLLPDRIPESVKNYINLIIDPGSLQAFGRSKLTSEQDVIDAMKHLYRLFVTEPEYIETYRKFFDLIQHDENLPLLFHCSAGKDRTGLAAALLLSALNIPRETILEDYMASNEYLAGKYQSLFEKNPANKFLYTTLPEYLESALDEVEKKYGSVKTFLIDEMKVNIHELQQKYLF
ncbi:tyrosine-protein phosphatase [Apibacter raozihei]|uniref:tyrosine-protein phosphatase n=1 Tax=Apibacter TaxID=1778601 RepID=UPI0013E3060B|nr:MULTISPECIES: tyrosine-protein phosphatase [Apibacter]